MSNHDIGLIGLAVMGQNLVMNMANKGVNVAVYNRTTEKMTEFIDGLGDRPEGVVEEGTVDRIHGYEQLEDFVNERRGRQAHQLVCVERWRATRSCVREVRRSDDGGDLGGWQHGGGDGRRGRRRRAGIQQTRRWWR